MTGRKVIVFGCVDGASCNAFAWQRGVSLIEVLVAIVVLSIGLLGLAGLQASGMRVGQSSIHRSQAAQLAYDMADRIRANLAAVKDYEIALTAAPPTGTTVAKRDLQDWRQRLRALPAGTGAVTLGASDVTIVVQWDDTRGAGTLRGTEEDTSDVVAAQKEQLSKLQTSQFQLTVQLSN